jgi:hypothetical protein
MIGESTVRPEDMSHDPVLERLEFPVTETLDVPLPKLSHHGRELSLEQGVLALVIRQPRVVDGAHELLLSPEVIPRACTESLQSREQAAIRTPRLGIFSGLFGADLGFGFGTEAAGNIREKVNNLPMIVIQGVDAQGPVLSPGQDFRHMGL